MISTQLWELDDQVVARIAQRTNKIGPRDDEIGGGGGAIISDQDTRSENSEFIPGIRSEPSPQEDSVILLETPEIFTETKFFWK